MAEKWKCFSVRILGSKVYDSYLVAKTRLAKYEDKSDPSDTDVQSKRIPVHTRDSDFNYSTDEEDDIADAKIGNL